MRNNLTIDPLIEIFAIVGILFIAFQALELPATTITAKISQTYTDGTIVEWEENMTVAECEQYRDDLLHMNAQTAFSEIADYWVECEPLP